MINNFLVKIKIKINNLIKIVVKNKQTPSIGAGAYNGSKIGIDSCVFEGYDKVLEAKDDSNISSKNSIFRK